MKKLVFVFGFMAFTHLATAQAKDPQLKKDAIELIKQTGSGSIAAIAKKQILPMIPADKQAAFLVEFEASLPALYDKLGDIYLELYTKEDIAAMKAFYNTPTGKKITAQSEVLTEKSQAAGMQWAEGLQGMLMKYMQ